MSDSAVKVKENELLPLVLEELPHLHISPHTLGRMWEQQIQQVDRLHAVGSPHGRRRSNLSSQVRVWLLKDKQILGVLHVYMRSVIGVFCQLEEAQRKHDLLVEILRKEQESKKRLVSIHARPKPPTCPVWTCNICRTKMVN